MAGLYFANTSGELDERARDYFTTLEALEDSLSIPRGYNRTLYAAVQHAIDHLGPGVAAAYRREARDTLYWGSLLAPELIPLDVVIPAATVTGKMDLANRPPVTAVAKPVSRAVIALLRTQTIAHRVVHRDEHEHLTPVSNTISMHPLVHEIIRDTFLKKLAPGSFQAAAAALMHHLTSWVGEMRAQEQYFALEQLRVHAEELLHLAAEQSTRQPAAVPQVQRVFTAARAVDARTRRVPGRSRPLHPLRPNGGRGDCTARGVERTLRQQTGGGDPERPGHRCRDGGVDACARGRAGGTGPSAAHRPRGQRHTRSA
ncbi:hypothetical protein ACTD5D_19280 [Nocardia takedensis]|uniref:hypothetical protein n=1 Tax=Nocardia takedensis TaxID=259390 RepID=UPI003F769B97